MSKLVIKLEIDTKTWEQLMAKFPELRNIPKATAVRVLLSKLLEV